MDKYQFGENGHIENTWAKGNDIQEQLVQFSFQCVRTSSDEMLAEKLNSLLKVIKKQIDENSQEYLVRCFQLIGLTRDIEGGKGERDLAYMMLFVWWGHYPRLAEFALRCFVCDGLIMGRGGFNGIPYGSWKDIKKLCQYIRLKTGSDVHPFIDYAVGLMRDQLLLDGVDGLEDSRLSLVARWVPRETSKTYGWIFCLLAGKMFPEYLESADRKGCHMTRIRAFTKAKMMLSRLVVRLNRRLDTTQIKMCGRDWSKINPHCVPSVLLMKNRAAFLNKTKKGEQRKDVEDRIICSQNFEKYIQERISRGKTVKGSRVGIVDFVKEALCYYSSSEMDLLNSQWNDFLSKITGGRELVAMVDQSGSMYGDPLYAAMGLGLVIASKSSLGRRVMTFSSEPTWISLENRETLIDGVQELIKHSHTSGLGTNFFKALSLLLNACITSALSNEVVSNMTLVILSDMMIDADTNEVDSRFMSDSSFDKQMEDMHKKIVRLYNDAGYSDVPHLLFWNLRHTSGFPTLSSIKGATMFSGFSPILLNSFCMNGPDALKTITPWDSFCGLLDGDRYHCLRVMVEQKFRNVRQWDSELHLGAYS